jgi:hypothetical protein
MTYDLLTMPTVLPTLDDVPAELREFYSFDADRDVFTLTDSARENIGKVADGICQLAAQRDQATRAAEQAGVACAIQDAVLLAGAAGPLARAAAALFASTHQVTMRDGRAVVVTDGGEFALKHAVAEFMHHGEGSAFLPQRPAENDDYFLRQMRRIKS